jgi:hypothetical protein
MKFFLFFPAREAPLFPCSSLPLLSANFPPLVSLPPRALRMFGVDATSNLSARYSALYRFLLVRVCCLRMMAITVERRLKRSDYYLIKSYKDSGECRGGGAEARVIPVLFQLPPARSSHCSGRADLLSETIVLVFPLRCVVVLTFHDNTMVFD